MDVWRLFCRLVVLSALLAALPAQAKVRATITDWGEVSAEQHPADPGQLSTGLAPWGWLTDWRYLNRDDHFEALLCRQFGATVLVEADGGDAVPDQIDARIRHPLLTRPDGATGTEDGFPVALTAGMAEAAWTFESRYELQPGEWTIEYSYRGEVLAGKTFDITGPGTPDSMCTGRPTS